MGWYESRAGDSLHEAAGGFRTTFYAYQEGGRNTGSWYSWPNSFEGALQTGKTVTNVDPALYTRQEQVLNPPKTDNASDFDILAGPAQKTIYHGYEPTWYLRPYNGYDFTLTLTYGEPRAMARLYREIEFSGAVLRFYPAQVVRYSGDALYTLEVDGSENWTFATGTPGLETMAIVNSLLTSIAIPAGYDPASETTFTLPSNGTIPKGTIVVPILVVDIQDYYDIQNALKAEPVLHMPFEVPAPRYTIPIGKTQAVGP